MKIIKVFAWFIVSLISLIVLLVTIVCLTILSLPRVTELKGCLTTTMYSVYLCPGSAHYVYLKDIAPIVAEAVIASEDTAFYSHNGFDWYEMEQSFKANMSDMHIHRGGSTMTQQLAKNVWLSKEKSYLRKAKEAYLTYQLEKNFDKRFILEKYLNVVQFGPKLFGVKDAAQYYFKKTPAELHLLEATFLAFLLPNPDVYSKSFQKGQLTPFASRIVAIILNRLVQFKKITPDEYQFAKSQIQNFPWSQLTVADFTNAHANEGSGPAEVIKENPDELDQFYNENGETSDESAAPDSDGPTN